MAITAYKCTACGAGISFNSELQLFKCEYCLSEFTKEEISAQTVNEETVTTSHTEEKLEGEFLSYTCKNCGAEVFADENTVADHCYYCHSPVVCDGRLNGELKPRYIIPFAYDKDEAESRFLKFAKKKWFVPKSFFAEKQLEKIQGVYYPFWLCDADVSANSIANAHNMRTWTVGKNLYTETSYYKLYRSGDIHFEDVTVGAFDKESKEILEGVLPYPTDALQEFSPEYLSGFLAKKRTVEHDEVTDEVKNKINGYSKDLLRDTMTGYDTVNQQNTNVQFKNVLWDYALMPLWMLNYKKKGKIMPYAMNGHTGKVYGELPLSFAKLWLMFFIILCGVTVLGSLIGMFLPALIVGAIAGGISMLCVWLSYSNKVHGSTYPLEEFSDLNLTDKKDNFITKKVVVTKIPDPPKTRK